MRNFLNKFGIPIVVVLLLLAALLAWYFLRPPARPGGISNLAYYVDEETQDESVRSSEEIPPLVGKEGKPTVVRAMKFSNEGGKNPKTLYLLKYTAAAQAQLQSLRADSPRRGNVSTQGELVRSPEPGSPWVSTLTPQGQAIIALPESPNGQPFTEVFPQK